LIYEALLRPLLFRLDPERVHVRTIALSHRVSTMSPVRAVVRQVYDWQSPELAFDVLGLHFRNPLGLAAGFDKHAEMFPLVPDLGFGHMEIGSVSLRPWRGNPSPTLFRLPEDHALINRLGLNSVGADVVLDRLRDVRFAAPTGLNIVKTADPTITSSQAIDDFVGAFARLYHAGSFVTLNLSCPNTADGRTFEDPALLAPLLAAMKQQERAMHALGARPVLVKLSPDLTDAQLDGILDTAEAHDASGYVVSNTTSRRDGLKTSAEDLRRIGAGGLSGAPLERIAQALVRRVASRVSRQRVIVACGGVGCDPQIDPAEQVWGYLASGATLVQLHTGLIYGGPGIAKRINQGLVRILRREGIGSLQDFFRARAAGAGPDARPSTRRSEHLPAGA
jgi:dihydroorotate dehydrogenase